ncbi:MAG: hypothetical protein HY923_01510 [Elusimicrobia bacterium]|nr:hypothetical protein [Elusimicrobiota bacterium]
MNKRLFLVLLGLAAGPLFAAGAALDTDETRAAERLAGRVRETLDGMLGPGRVKLLVEVRGERLEVQTESEIVSPLDKTTEAGRAAARLLELPGYTKGRSAAEATFGGDKTKEPGAVFFQKEHEHSRRDSGFEIKSIAATVVFDTALSSDAIREASQILPQLLRLDTTRGDTLTILQAPMPAAWRFAFTTEADWRALAYVAAASIIALIVALIGGMSFIRAARVFASELAGRREAPMAAGAALASPMLPELSSGLPLGLQETEAAAGGPAGAGASLALGRRFDFLSSSDAGATAKVLSSVEAPELALLFGYLAEAMPEAASRLFAMLPGPLQAETSRNLLKLSVADPEKLNALEDRLRTAVANVVQGPQRLAKILSRVSGDTRAEMLDRLAVEDASGVQDVQSRLFSFEDIVRLSPAELRRLLGAVPYESWGAALRGAPNALFDRVLADLPEGPRQFVRDAAATPQTRDKIVAARSGILDALTGLSEKGQLNMGKDGPGGGLV